MSTALIGMAIVPGTLALLLFALFTYLYSQSRAPYFRAWQLGWGAYCLHFAVRAVEFGGVSQWTAHSLADVLLLFVALCVFTSVRLVDGREHSGWRVGALAAAGVAWAVLEARAAGAGTLLSLGPLRLPFFPVEVGIAVLLLFSAFLFWRQAQRRDSTAFRLLSFSVAAWSLFLLLENSHAVETAGVGRLAYFLDPLPQMLLGISMVMVLYESERRTLQEHLLEFSSLELATGDEGRLPGAQQVAGSLEKVLDRLLAVMTSERALLLLAEPWSEIVAGAQRGFTAETVVVLEKLEAAHHLGDAAYRGGGPLHLGLQALPAAEPKLVPICEVLAEQHVEAITAVSLHTRERRIGVVVFAHGVDENFGPAQLRLLHAVSAQVGTTLENYLLMQEARRRTKEYELLTQLGQVVSSRLNADEVLHAIHKELGQLFDTSNFYVAFVDPAEVRFELDVENDEPRPKRRRKRANGLTEHVVRTGEPLLVRSDMESLRERLGVEPQDAPPARSFCGVPIRIQGQAVGVMAALSSEREMAFGRRDLEIMETAAAQLSVAMENARVFGEEQRRARYLAFLNNISKTAISSQHAEEMLAEIVGEIQKNFQFDHIGIGILDYASKEIEIKAEAGSTALALGRRVPLGVGILGRVARTNEMVLAQDGGASRLLSILPDAQSVLCIPIAYGESLLGVLNVESRRDHAFEQQEVLILRTLADLLATALHNAFVFQKMQQQSITDALTGIKTRRFFLEALQGEWKRASRSGRAFSVVLIDLDKFKEVNDTMGHLEGDLVLARIGRLLEQKCRHSNVVARYGGDEFVILMPETGVEQAQVLSERLRLWIATDPMLNERQITGSFGVATFPLHGATVEDIVRVADAGMYVSKHAGGNRVSTAEELADGQYAIPARQLVNAYVEGFLQRDHSGSDAIDELVGTLRKLATAVKENERDAILCEAVRSLALAAETREVNSPGHGDAVAKYCEVMGRELGLEEDDLRELLFAARVHDVGKIVIPERILNKPTALTAEEYRVVKAHPVMGVQIIEAAHAGARVRKAVRHHHERWDGAGYPDALKGEEIPLWARVIAVAEAYSNMINERSYAALKTPSEAVSELETLSGSQFDGALVQVLVRRLRAQKSVPTKA